MGNGGDVAQFVVRNIEKEVKVRLQRRASRHGRSMEEEVRDILRNAVNEQDVAIGGLGTEIASLFSSVGLDEEIPELRGYETKPASFDRCTPMCSFPMACIISLDISLPTGPGRNGGFSSTSFQEFVGI